MVSLPTPFTATGPPADAAEELVAAVRAGRADELVSFAGQTVGLIDAIVPARDVIEALVTGVQMTLASVSSAVQRG